MRRSFIFALSAGPIVSAFTPLRAYSADADTWFARAAEVNSSGNGTQLAKPDFLPGSSMKSLCHVSGLPGTHLSGTWRLIAYDRAHRIGLAAAGTDECAVALFSASTPPVKAPSANLSAYRTARGLHVGSAYADVVSAYGGPPAARGHIVRHFFAHVRNAQTLGTPKRTVPMRIDLSGLY